LITVIGAILRIFRLGYKSLFIDELGQVFIASKDIRGFYEAMTYQLTPPLDYFLLRITLLFGNSDFIIRINSAIFGIAAVVIVFYFSKQLFNLEVGIISSLLLAFSRFHIYYSQEARMYSLFCLLTLSSFYILWLYVHESSKKNYWILVLINAALLYTHYYGIYVIATQLFWIIPRAFFSNRKEKFSLIIRKIVEEYSFYFIIGLLYLPWLSSLRTQLSQPFNSTSITYGYSQTTYNNLLNVFSRLSWHTIYSQIITRRYEGLIGSQWPSNILSPLELIFFSLAIFGLLYYLFNKREKRSSILYLCLWFILPIIFFALFQVHENTRYYIFIVPPYIIFIALGIAGLRELLLRNKDQTKGYIVFSVFLLPIIFSISVSLYDYYFRLDKDDWRGVGNFLEQHAEPDDVILVLGGHAGYMEHYYKGNAVVIDADFLFPDPAAINNYQDLADFVLNQECSWIFVSQHSNNVFDYETYNIENYELTQKVRNLLIENMDIVEEAYNQGGSDLPGLYHSNNCDPY